MIKKRFFSSTISFLILLTVSYGMQEKVDLSGKTENDILLPFWPDNRHGLINNKGDIVVQPQFEWLKDFNEGLAGVRIGGKWGFIGKDGKFRIKPRFQYIFGSFSEKLACVMENYKCGFIDNNGIWKIRPQFDYAEDFSEGIAKVEIEGKVGFIDTNGQFVIKPEFSLVWHFSEGLAPAKKTPMGKWGYIDKKGNMVIPAIYNEASSFCEGLAAVEKGNKYGFIDKTGKALLDFKYDLAGDFSEGLASISINKKHGYINHAGELVILLSGERFSEGLAAVEIGSSYAFINNKGKVIIGPKKFLVVFPFENGVSLVVLKVFGKKAIAGYLNKKGNIIKQWSFDSHALLTGCPIPRDPHAFSQLTPPIDSITALEIGGNTGIEPPRITKKVLPEYPKDAGEKNIHGTVILVLEIDIYGKVIIAHAVKGPELLRAAAEKALKQWIFEPTIIDGIPRRVKMTERINF